MTGDTVEGDASGSSAAAATAGSAASVSKYYGQTLRSSADLKTTACCLADAMPRAHRAVLAQLADEVVSKFYGCGSTIPPEPHYLEGATVLDLGCGTGRDVYLASALVGERGRVVGVDMTEQQLEVARRYAGYHAERFFGAASKTNVQFALGNMEELRAVGVGSGSVDVVVSNCVLNLASDKAAVFAEIFRVLRDGGELYFSDVYTDRRLSDAARQHELLYNECLGGALYVHDFRRVMRRAGFADVRLVRQSAIDVTDAALKRLVPDVTFLSCTFRAFKAGGGGGGDNGDASSLDEYEMREDYGHTAVYHGGLHYRDGDEHDDERAADGHGCAFTLDAEFTFSAGVPVRVDANTASILQSARLRKHFTLRGGERHLGPWTPRSADQTSERSAAAGCGSGGCATKTTGGSCCRT